MNHTEARKHVVEAFRLLFGRPPTLQEAQAAQGVGLLESRYGQGWKGAGVGSKNWGAVQKSKPPCDPANSFLYTDTHPQPDGTSTSYSICFWKYETDTDGAAALIRIAFGSEASPKGALKAATRGDLYGVSAAMRAQRYYEGFGKTQADRIANHHKALSNAVRAICREMGEPFPSAKPTAMATAVAAVRKLIPMQVPATIRRGSSGTVVRDWQRILGVPTDGIFGPVTEASTKAWQKARHLVSDGIVGRETWGAAESEAKAAA